MTYQLETKNHGQIEAGYFSIITDRVRFDDLLGSFTVYSKHFAQFVTGLAKGEYRWGVPIVEDKDTWAVAEYNPQNKLVSIGYCDIAVDEFGRFADYVFQGGICGWGSAHPPEWRPDFVLEAREKVEKHLRWRKKESAYLQDAQQKELPRLEDVLREI